MGRRYDHSREELEALFVAEGARHLAEVGLARFSAREVAKRVGYSVGTLYNVFGSYDGLILAINAGSLRAWTAALREHLADAGEDRINALVRGYFDFAISRPHAWSAIFEHHMAAWGAAPDWYQAVVGELVGVVAAEVGRATGKADPTLVAPLTRSLVATVHGHCVFAVQRAFDMLGETAPAEAALARVREAIAAARAGGGAS
jgi:AcrR family transcriptional regulator